MGGDGTVTAYCADDIIDAVLKILHQKMFTRALVDRRLETTKRERTHDGGSIRTPISQSISTVEQSILAL